MFDEFVLCLDQTFGKGELEITKDNFTNCGVRHTKAPSGGYEMDQMQYLQALRPIVHKDLTGLKGEDKVSEALAKLFLSLLMACAYALMTRVDMCVFVIALQRRTQEPTALDIRRLNAVVRWAQKHPLSLCYLPMQCAGHMEVHSDSGFRKEEKDGVDVGRAVRGGNFMRLSSPASTTTAQRKVRCHLLDWHCGSLKVVTRSTSASEAQAAILAIDHGLALQLTMHEIKCGPVSPRQGMELRDRGGASFEITVAVDAISIISALEPERIKPPAEQSLLSHLLWLREIVDRRIMDSLVWRDTREMTADGHHGEHRPGGSP